MERAVPDKSPASNEQSFQPGERSGNGTSELFKLIDEDEQRRGAPGDAAVQPAATAPVGDASALASTGANQALEDWLRTHRELLALETAFTDLAIQAAMGEVPPDKLAQERTVLEATRELCSLAYRRAFPQNQGN